MEKTIYRKGEKVNYQCIGEGNTIVLLHGYLESLAVWGDFKNELAKGFKVLAVDLPGFGKSDEQKMVTYMDGMADAVNSVLEAENTAKCFMIGHSMGGYATLAFAEKYSDKLNGFCLFHSSPYSDNEEKREHRRREIGLIDMGKKELIINFNIPQTFAADNLEKFADDVERIKKIAIATKDDGIKNALKGMMQRPDRHFILHEFDKPMLLIAGTKDNYIPLDVAKSVAENAPKLQLEVLEHSGHMGFLEEMDKSLSIIKDFTNKLSW